MAGAERFLSGRLKLKVNRAKSAVARPEARKFLGFSFTSEAEPRRRIAPPALARFTSRVRALTRRTAGSVGIPPSRPLCPMPSLPPMVCPWLRPLHDAATEPPCTDPYARWCGRGEP
jgi:hypothetical protein